MNEQNRITIFLKENPSFTTKDFVGMVKESQAAYSDRKAYRMLQDLQDDGRIMKVGRGHYSKTSVKSPYHFKASSLMDELVSLIDKEYPLITYQTWELYQWNEFVNHQLAHNAYFIEVESGLETTVFDMLLEKYPRVLLDPGMEEYYRYRADDMIIVQKLISGAPAPQPGSKQASLEKLLVDIFSRKLTGQLIERAEYRQIYEDAFGKYAINELGQAIRPTSRASQAISQASQAKAISQVIVTSQVMVRVPVRPANTTPTPSTPQMARPNTAMSSMNIRAMPLLTRKALMTMTSAVSLATTSATFTVMVKAAREAANKKPLPREANSRNQTKNNNY